jgi:hypothetical protein
MTCVQEVMGLGIVARSTGQTVEGCSRCFSLRRCASSSWSRIRVQAIGPPDARAVWSVAQFVTLDSRPVEGAFRAIRRGMLAQWEAQSSRAGTEALSAIPDAVLGWRESGAAARQPAVLSARCRGTPHCGCCSGSRCRTSACRGCSGRQGCQQILADIYLWTSNGGRGGTDGREAQS